MSSEPLSIPSQPALSPAADYYALRREGIGFIEQMASALWTDYNAHDPGITILEQLCFALTDLAYRNGWDIKDLLTPARPSGDPAQPFPDQAFFTARDILTVNPVTADDLRRLLIGLNVVRNAWVFCKQCACDVLYYAWHEGERQVMSYRKPDPGVQPVVRVDVQGLYEVLLELEADADAGDLNDRKVDLKSSIEGADGTSYALELELRFPEWELARPADWQAFVKAGDVLAVKLVSLGADKHYDVLNDAGVDQAGRERYLREHWNHALYLGFEVVLPGAVVIAIRSAALHLFGDNTTRSNMTLARLQEVLQDSGSGGAIARYRSKVGKALRAVNDAWQTLASHRNLDEDYCRVACVAIEDVAVCADIEVAPDVDIESVQAQAWFLIEQYFNPAVRHYSLQEMLDGGTSTEDIFNGPMPQAGFLKHDELAASRLKSVLRNSDIINLLMGIKGVVAVGNLLLSKFDEDGELVKGAADPSLDDGKPVFDPLKSSAAWQLYLSPLHQPRLYFKRSRFLFHKNGLPFLARRDEAADTLMQLRGEAERSKIKDADLDLPVPAGTYRNPAQYHPVQYGFPQAYGIGPQGLSQYASPLRKAQARQLQAYLMVFEQLLANAYAQLGQTAELFSLNPAVSQSYFAGTLNAAQIKSYKDVVEKGLNALRLSSMTETAVEFHQRRNRFLDHLMARFGENFAEYALLLTDLNGLQSGQARLINDKIAFLKAYPRISHGRAKAFDYTLPGCTPDNSAGIKQRVSLLLGFAQLRFAWVMSGPGIVSGYALEDQQARIWLSGAFAQPVAAASDNAARQLAFARCISRLSQPGAYEVIRQGAGYKLTVIDVAGQPMGERPQAFTTLAAAQEAMDELLAFSSNQRMIVVEHLLLRPKFPGDALFPAGSSGACGCCDDADPYSFRLSFVIPGWIAPFSDNLTLRGFADRTIAQELPSHLLAKLCWVGNEGFVPNPCAGVVADVAALLASRWRTIDAKQHSEADTCRCAEALYLAFSAVFTAWYADRMLEYLQPAALQAALQSVFATQPDRSTIVCTNALDESVFTEVRALMIRYFQSVAFNGWQFERFENAWCAWLQANAAFNWTQERVQARVQAILDAGLSGAADEPALCACAADLTLAWGQAFDAWMQANIASGRQPVDFTPFAPPALVLCPGLEFKPGTGAQVEALLMDRYCAYIEVSYRLRVVLALLGNLRNAYPEATLHDCDEGSDLNPVRLGSTALGDLPRHKGALPAVSEPAPSVADGVTTNSGNTRKRSKRSKPTP
ncbi:hypothetical protein ACIQUS_20095 [Pseudomonas sp. NPDC090755]|uniref:hypothetical protein n=1 Tax=Pseudomonas sp. NPDC090755 TaxID=3364481 RepID=UPI00383A0127